MKYKIKVPFMTNTIFLPNQCFEERHNFVILPLAKSSSLAIKNLFWNINLVSFTIVYVQMLLYVMILSIYISIPLSSCIH